MSTVAECPRARRDAAPPVPPAAVRHGKCHLDLSIGGTHYRLTPLVPPPGSRVAWSLHKRADDHSAVYRVVAAKGQDPACTCPDHRINGAVCKHIGALMALGLIPGRRAGGRAER